MIIFISPNFSQPRSDRAAGPAGFGARETETAAAMASGAANADVGTGIVAEIRRIPGILRTGVAHARHGNRGPRAIPFLFIMSVSLEPWELW